MFLHFCILFSSGVSTGAKGPSHGIGDFGNGRLEFVKPMTDCQIFINQRRSASPLLLL
jgi:hypothetical protein